MWIFFFSFLLEEVILLSDTCYLDPQLLTRVKLALHMGVFYVHAQEW